MGITATEHYTTCTIALQGLPNVQSSYVPEVCFKFEFVLKLVYHFYCAVLGAQFSKPANVYQTTFFIIYIALNLYSHS